MAQLKDSVPANAQKYIPDLEKMFNESQTSLENVEHLQKSLFEAKAEREEMAIELKSQVIIYKEKAKHYKQQMQRQKMFHDEESEALLNEKVVAAKDAYVSEMNNIASENMKHNKEIEALQAEKAELAQRVADFENIVVDLRSTKDERINDLETKLATIESSYNKKLTKIKGRREDV